MDAESPRRDEELSDLERRLRGWRPAPAGQPADAMLFAAGQAAGRRQRSSRLWPGLSALLALVALGLGAWGVSERSERLVLANRLREHLPTQSAPRCSEFAAADESSYSAPSPYDYFHLRQLAEQDACPWQAPLPAHGAPAAPPPVHPIPRAGQREDLPEL